MNPRPMRSEEVEDCLRLLAPRQLIESGAGDRLVDADDDLQALRMVMFPHRMRSTPPASTSSGGSALADEETRRPDRLSGHCPGQVLLPED
jgi:hypothetical protein